MKASANRVVILPIRYGMPSGLLKAGKLITACPILISRLLPGSILHLIRLLLRLKKITDNTGFQIH